MIRGRTTEEPRIRSSSMSYSVQMISGRKEAYMMNGKGITFKDISFIAKRWLKVKKNWLKAAHFHWVRRVVKGSLGRGFGGGDG